MTATLPGSAAAWQGMWLWLLLVPAVLGGWSCWARRVLHPSSDVAEQRRPLTPSGETLRRAAPPAPLSRETAPPTRRGGTAPGAITRAPRAVAVAR